MSAHRHRVSLGRDKLHTQLSRHSNRASVPLALPEDRQPRRVQWGFGGTSRHCVMILRWSPLMNQWWYILPNESHTLIISFLLPSVLFLFQDPTRNPTLPVVIMSPEASLDCGCFSDFPYFWWPWQIGRVLVTDFIQCPSTGICLMFFSQLGWSYKLLGGRPPR